DIEVACYAVEAEAPRVAQTVSPDLGSRALNPYERVVARDRVALARYVDAQQLAEERVEVLAVTFGVATAAAVAESDVQVAVGTEGQLPTVVVRVRLLLCEQDRLAAAIGAVGVGARHEARHGSVALP